MKKIYYAFLLLLNIGCSEFPPTQFETENVHFTFSNYTDEAYLNATISIAEIINDSIFITETLDSISIPPKDLNAEYSQVSTVNSNKWEKGIVDLYDNVYLVENAQACYLIDLNGSKKIAIGVSFMGDPWFNAMDVYPNPSDDDIIIKNDSLIHPKMISIDSMKIVN